MKKENILRLLRDEDLARSGLDKPSVRKKLGIEDVLSIEKTEAITSVEEAASYEIPYYSPEGKPLKYSRWKLIPTGDDVGIKYYQDEKTIPRLYLPRLLDWVKITQDTSRRIIITEGEKKAACACLFKLPCISVGGVWSWKAKKWSMDKLPDFNWFKWKDREVEICYDGDMYSNENVARALDSLTAMLTKEGARVFVRYLPNQEGISKLDDYLMERGVDAYNKLDLAEHESSRELTSLNERVIYVEDINSYLSIEDGNILGGERELHRRFGTTKIISDTGRPIKATEIWSTWPHRRSVRTLTYEPGKERFFDGTYNDWRGWGTSPKKGNVSDLLEVIKAIEDWRWLLQWMAYPIQNPGAKLMTAVVIWSIETGTGKTFIGKILQEIYGERNSGEITSTMLHDGRLTWVANKQFILGEEVSDFSHKYSDRDALKSVITSNTVTINPKYVKPHVLPNKANIMFTSNHPDAMKMERQDRRFFVGRLDLNRPQRFWDRLDKWAWKQGGAAAFHWYLMNKVDVSDFNPRERAPMTHSKEEMIHHGMSDLELICYSIVEDFDLIKKKSQVENAIPKNKDVFTVTELTGIVPDLENYSTAAIGKSLVRVGAVKHKKTIRTKGGVKRLIAVRNLDHWKKNLDNSNMWSANYESKVIPIRKRKRK